MWNLQHGKYLDTYRAVAKTGTMPSALLNQPELQDENRLAWNCYIELSKRRQNGFGPNPISYETIVFWLNENRVVDFDTREETIYLVSKLDDAFLEFAHKELEKDKNKK